MPPLSIIDGCVNISEGLKFNTIKCSMHFYLQKQAFIYLNFFKRLFVSHNISPKLPFLHLENNCSVSLV